MRRKFVVVGKVIIVLFCVWHMFAMMLSAMPFSDMHRPAVWVRKNLRPLVNTYAVTLNQWQRWHVFVPENPTYEMRYALELDRPGVHHPAVLLSPEDATLMHGTDETAKAAFLTRVCAHLGLLATDSVWLEKRDYIFPDYEALKQPGSGVNTSLEWYQAYEKLYSCTTGA